MTAPTLFTHRLTHNQPDAEGYAHLQAAQLQGAHLEGAHFQGANLNDASLEGVINIFRLSWIRCEENGYRPSRHTPAYGEHKRWPRSPEITYA